MKKTFFILFTLGSLIAFAQQPKLHLKLFTGINTNTFIYRIEGIEPEILAGFQFGGGMRVSHRHLFFEGDFTYVNSGITIGTQDGSEIPVEDQINVRMRALEIPLTAGYIPVKTAFFKWYLYGGLANRINIKGKIEYKGEEIMFEPKEVQLHNYNLGARFGTQFDIAVFNIDLSYTLGLTNTFKAVERTNTHYLQLSVGMIF